jgi:hypothetical protein
MLPEPTVGPDQLGQLTSGPRRGYLGRQLRQSCRPGSDPFHHLLMAKRPVPRPLKRGRTSPFVSRSCPSPLFYAQVVLVDGPPDLQIGLPKDQRNPPGKRWLGPPPAPLQLGDPARAHAKLPSKLTGIEPGLLSPPLKFHSREIVAIMGDISHKRKLKRPVLANISNIIAICQVFFCGS